MKTNAFVLGGALLLSACSFGVDHPLQHLSASDQSTLNGAMNGDGNATHALFLKSLDKSLDGEDSRQCYAELEEFLNRVGQDKFFAAWQKEQPPVRVAVADRLDSMLRNNPDLYPLYRKMSAVDGKKLEPY